MKIAILILFVVLVLAVACAKSTKEKAKAKAKKEKEQVYVFVNPNGKSTKYHENATVHNMDSAIRLTKEEAENLGFTPCAKCFDKK